MKTLPDKNGHFDIFGGRYAAETLMPALLELEEAYDKAKKDKSFAKEFDWYRREYAGRPTPLYLAKRMTQSSGRRKNLSQTRRSESYRFAQNQQHAGTGASGPPDGQEESHC